MDIPKWKQWLSYLTDIHIESVASAYSDALHVYLSKGRLQLSTDKAIYSWEDRYENFFKTFQHISLPDNGSDVLVLGFGMGSIPWMLEKKLDKQYQYTGVELDEEVIYLASKYTIPQLESDIAIIEADAYNYLQLESRTYDIVCVDIFVEDVIPEIFLKDSFIKAASQCLSDNGVLIFNHLANSPSTLRLAENYYEQIFKSQFSNSESYQVLGNRMLIGHK